MNKKISRCISTATIILSLMSGQSFAEVLVVGSQGPIANNIAEHFNQETGAYIGQQNEGDLLYVHVATATDIELDSVKKSIINKNLVVLDMTGYTSEDIRSSKTKDLIGMGVSAPVIIKGVSKGKPLTNFVVSNPTSENPEENINKTVLHELENNFEFKG